MPQDCPADEFNPALCCSNGLRTAIEHDGANVRTPNENGAPGARLESRMGPSIAADLVRGSAAI